MRLTQSQFHYDVQPLRELASTLQDHMMQYGYETVETAIIEAADLFLTKAGDQIIQRLFTFEQQGRSLALRPEFTAAAAYHYAQQYELADQQPVARWQFNGFIFENDPTDLSRNYQRMSIDAELIGLSGPAADAEIISMALHGIQANSAQNLQIVVGHVGLLWQLMARFDLDSRTQHFLLSQAHFLNDPALGKAYVLEQIDQLLIGRDRKDKSLEVFVDYETEASAELNTQHLLDVLLDATQSGATMGGRTRYDIVRRLVQKRKRAVERDQIIAALDFMESWRQVEASPEEAFAIIETFIAPQDSNAQAILTDWRRCIDLLVVNDIPVEIISIRPNLARSWEYYTGMVFEIYSTNQLHLAGGGRYDGLTRLVGGERDVPAVGFVYYVDQLLEAITTITNHKQEFIEIIYDDGADVMGTRWAHLLRKLGKNVRLFPHDKIPSNNFPYIRIDDAGIAYIKQQPYNFEDIDLLLVSLK